MLPYMLATGMGADPDEQACLREAHDLERLNHFIDTRRRILVTHFFQLVEILVVKHLSEFIELHWRVPFVLSALI
jgi:hypothetical protein